jgi:hypothetical protein
MTKAQFFPRGGPAMVLGLTTVAAVGAIIYSHDSQVRERQVMRAGVERDKERLRLKRHHQNEEQQQHLHQDQK